MKNVFLQIQTFIYSSIIPSTKLGRATDQQLQTLFSQYVLHAPIAHLQNHCVSHNIHCVCTAHALKHSTPSFNTRNFNFLYLAFQTSILASCLCSVVVSTPASHARGRRFELLLTSFKFQLETSVFSFRFALGTFFAPLVSETEKSVHSSVSECSRSCLNY